MSTRKEFRLLTPKRNKMGKMTPKMESTKAIPYLTTTKVIIGYR